MGSTLYYFMSSINLLKAIEDIFSEGVLT